MYFAQILCLGLFIGCTSVAANAIHRAECNHNADIVFVMDSSGSILPEHWEKMKRYVKLTVKALHDVGATAHLGLVSFDHAVDDNHVIPLTSHENKDQFLQELEVLPLRGGGTNIDLGMKRALDLFEDDHRPHAHNTVVLLTDGNGSGVPLKTVGQWFHDEHIRIVVAAIGDGVDEAGLKSMTLDESKTHEKYFPINHIQEITSKKTLDSLLEGCNFAYDCHAGNVQFLYNGQGVEYDTATSFKDCATKCKNRNGCRYFTWFGPNYDETGRRQDPRKLECYLYTEEHCGYYGSTCTQARIIGAESGSIQSCLDPTIWPKL